MNEKMTDEALDGLRHRTTWDASDQVNVLAHIGALTAERDEQALKARACSALAAERGAGLDALRERVQALDYEVALMKERAKNSEEGRERAREVNATLQTRLAAIRQRMQALEAQCDERRRAFVSENVRAQNAEDRLAAIRQRAGDERRMAEHALPSEKAGLVTRAIDRILGDDARPSAPPEAFAHEKGLDAGVFDELSQSGGRVLAYEGNQPIVLATMPPKLEGPLDSPADMIDEAPLNPDATSEADQSIPEVTLEIAGLAEPTISEAFAAVREYIHGDRTQIDHEDVERASRALSLLERRMGAMALALREVHTELVPIAAEHHNHTGADPQEECEWYSCEHERTLRAALTDAPPVFTLEEVANAVREYTGSETAVDDVRSALTALRR